MFIYHPQKKKDKLKCKRSHLKEIKPNGVHVPLCALRKINTSKKNFIQKNAQNPSLNSLKNAKINTLLGRMTLIHQTSKIIHLNNHGSFKYYVIHCLAVSSS